MDIIHHSILLIVLVSCILATLANGNPHGYHHHGSSPGYRGNSDDHPDYHAAVAGNNVLEDVDDQHHHDGEEKIPWTWADVLSGRDHPIYGHPVDIEHTVYLTKTVWVDPPAKTAAAAAAAMHHNY
ncbi:hypothetical protein K492DRAFT_200182 [Lichtheimia hyalospora FSU 10163]|nr:hypothetical protein K492DRAFT_200182 [Lichtheimia hyalospora FSU 10163]